MSKAPKVKGEAEQAVLGAILVRPEVMDTVADILAPEDFRYPGTALIYRAMLAIYQQHGQIDLVTVSSALKDAGQLQVVGGPVFLAGLSEQVGFATNAEHYARIVKDTSLLYQLWNTGRQIGEMAEGKVPDVRAAIDQAGAAIFALSDSSNRGELRPTSSLVGEMQSTVEAVRETGVTGVSTGYNDLDRMLHGFQLSDLIVLAARPSMGKTALALNIARNVAKQQAGAVLFFSLEMANIQLMMRLASSEAGIDSERLRLAMMSGEEWSRYEAACNRIANLPLYIDDTPALTPIEIRARARRIGSREPLKLVVVDYLQLARSVKKNAHSREQEVSDISQSLKALAKELKVPVLALSQLSRACEQRLDKRPMLSDLRESGAIEQDADVVMFIYRDEVYNTNSPAVGTAEVLIRKARNGPTGQVTLAFNANLTRFQNYTQLGEG